MHFVSGWALKEHDESRLRSLHQQIEARVSALPGVRAASFSAFTFWEGEWMTSVFVAGDHVEQDNEALLLEDPRRARQVWRIRPSDADTQITMWLPLTRTEEPAWDRAMRHAGMAAAISTTMKGALTPPAVVPAWNVRIVDD
jgi:hypothetical protein